MCACRPRPRAAPARLSRARGCARDDKEFDYRIYRSTTPMQPGETPHARASRPGAGSAASATRGNDTRLVDNGTFLNNYRARPGDRHGPRRRCCRTAPSAANTAFRAELRPPKLEDLSATRPQLFRRRLGRPPTSPSPPTPTRPRSRRATRSRTSISGRPAHGALRHRRADPDLLLDPVGPLCREAPRSTTASIWPSITTRRTTGTSTGCSTRCRPALDYYQANFGPYQFDQARIIEFPGYDTLRPGLRQHHALFGGDRLHRRQSAIPTRSTTSPTSPPTSSATNIGRTRSSAPTCRAATMLSRDPRPIFGADGDEEALRRGQDPPLPQVRAGPLSARAAAARLVEELPLDPGREPAIHPLPQGLAGHVPAAGPARRGRGQPRRCARVLEQYAFKGAPYPRSIDLVEALRARGDDAGGPGADHRPVREDHPLRPQGRRARRRCSGPTASGTSTVPVEARKFYADGKGNETPGRLRRAGSTIGLFTAEPGRGAFDRKNVS